MKLKENIILQYTLITFLIVSLGSCILAYFLTERTTHSTLQSHAEHYPQIISNFLSLEPHVVKIFHKDTPPEELNIAIKSLNRLLAFENILRIKVWDRDGLVLWSDDTNIIGKTFPDNEDLHLTIQGAIQYEVEHPTKAENKFDRNNKVLELYVPVYSDQKVLGAIEIYEDADSIFWNIHRANMVVYFLVGGAGAVLYILLFFIYWRSFNRQRKINSHLLETQEVIISSLAHQAEIRDIETGKHIERTSNFVKILAEDLSNPPPKYLVRDTDKNYLNEHYIRDLVKSAPLHDIGKVGVSDAILNKPGKLTDAEFEQMKKHCEYGAAILVKAEEKLAHESFLTLGIQLALSHHERWDGKGYPYGLKGEDIPLSARIMAVADVYDALRTERCYKKAFSHEKTKSILLEGKGTQFDPQIIDSFVRQEKQFEKISTELAD